MELIFEILFDFIVEGTVGAVGDKKVPLPLRIVAAVFLVALFGTLIAVIIVAAVRKIIKKHRN